MPLATPIRRMPKVDDVSEFLADLLAKQVEVTKVADVDVSTDERALVSSILIEDDDHVAGLVIADLAFACHAGAALIMVPAATATACIESGELSELLRENFYEVANIMTALVNGPTVAHVRIRDLVDGVPDEARDLIMKASGRRTYQVTIPGYGDGIVALFAE